MLAAAHVLTEYHHLAEGLSSRLGLNRVGACGRGDSVGIVPF
jgi:hypothetical protein